MITSLIIILLLTFTSPIKAQTEVAPVKADLIDQQANYEQAISQTQSLYRQELENYRSLERNQLIAADQYVSLNTLAALEDLVKQTKDLAISRNLVLKYYFTLLQLNLDGAPGVELALKNEYLTNLNQAIAFLETHQQQLEQANSREEVQAALVVFEQLGDPESFAEQVLGILAIAQLQAIYDLALPLKNDLDDFLAKQRQADQSALERASQQTDQVLAEAGVSLRTLWVEDGDNNGLRRIYQRPTEKLNPIYVTLSQSLVYFEELLELN